MAIESDRVVASQVRRVLTLRTFPGYAHLPPDQLAVVAEHARERSYAKGSHLLTEGSPVRSIFFIVRGKVEFRRSGRSVRVMGAKAIVGGLAAFAEDPRGYDCIALEDTEVLEMSSMDTFDIFEDNFLLLQIVLRGMAREVLDARRRLPQGAGFSNDVEEDCHCSPDPLDLVERMALIRQSMTFAQSRLDAISDMAREAREVRLPAGTSLWKEGDLADHFLILVTGLLECRTEDGQSFRFGPGDVVGVLDANADVPRWFTADVARDLVALRIDTESLGDVLEDNFDMARDLLRGMAGAILGLLETLSSVRPPPD